MKNKNFKNRLTGRRNTQSLLAATITALAIGGAYAQDTQIEEIVVTGTGTSIRGEAPVGQNLISITREDIAETGAVSVQQILNDVPQVTGFGNSGQGGYGASDGSGAYAPTIHSLGASASNSTLTVINGHRLPLTGISHNVGDPSIIPPAALERVEVLPDGASATYGSDAVAGVLNFITRTDVEGIEVSAQSGFADGKYRTANFNILTGSSWDSASVIASYSYSYRSGLRNADRPNIASDLRDRGGSNFADDNCGPGATLDTGSGGAKYFYPYSATNIIESGENFCTTRAYTDLIAAELKHSIFVSYKQDFSDNLVFDAEVVYSQRNSDQTGSRGTPSVRVNQADGNPYFEVAPDNSTSYTARWDSNPWFGNGSTTDSGAATFMLTGGLEYDFGNGWYANAGGTVGRNESWRRRWGSICTDCLEEALAGIDINGETFYMDIWGPNDNINPVIIRHILDSTSVSNTVQSMVDLQFKVDGSLMELPAGTMKVAFGADATSYTADYHTNSRNGGPASLMSRTRDLLITRDVNALFGEVLIPVTDGISVSAALRYDDYSDFGSTTNPRIAAQWQVTDAIKVRASWAESFVAPALSSRGQEGTGLTTESNWGGNGSDGFIPVGYSDPRTNEFLTWMQTYHDTACDYDGTTLLGCTFGQDGADGARVAGGNDDLVPATGETWSVGIDLNHPDWLPGFRGSVTYYSALLNQMITAPRLSNILEVPGLNNRVVLMPTQAELDDWTNGIPQTSDIEVYTTLPGDAVLPFMWSFQQINAFNIDSAGLDISLNYSWDTDLGNVSVGYSANKKTRFDQQAGTGGPWVDYLNVDANTTFSSLEYLSTMNVGWRNENASAKLTWKHQDAYDGRFVDRRETIDAFDTFNFYASYSLDANDLVGDTQIFLQVQNLLDEEPPFVNSSGGYNSSDSSPLGRLATIGLRTSF